MKLVYHFPVTYDSIRTWVKSNILMERILYSLKHQVWATMEKQDIH